MTYTHVLSRGLAGVRSPDDGTDSSPVKNRPVGLDRAQAETTKADAGETTPSCLPVKAAVSSAKPEKDEEEGYILEREPDGRYRIIGRRPLKHKKTVTKPKRR
jgi:hypothetical protein